MGELNNSAMPNLKEFIGALGALAVLEGKVTNRPVDSEFVQKLKLWSSGLFRIVVMGEIKQGKSSFINALLGVRDLVPVSSDVATSTIYKICYGEEVAYKVFFTEESKKPSIVISRDSLAQYGTEDGNPGNEKQVEFIQVFAPSAFLKNGLVIIDTPGLGGLFKQHKRITYEYVPKADAVFMVSDSVEAPIGKDELDVLEEVKKITSQIYFVQTKAMAVDKTAREARAQNNRRILVDHGFDSASLRYFIVDSHLKFEADEAKDKDDLIDSGFIPLTMFVNNEIKAKVGRNIMRSAINVARPKFAAVENAIAQDEKLLAADNEGARAEIAKELESADEEAMNWQRYDLPRMQDKLQDGIRAIRAKVADRTRKFRPGGEVQEYVSQRIDACPDIDSLFQSLTEFTNNAAGVFSQARYEILKEVHSEIARLLGEMNDCKYAIASDAIPASVAVESIDVNTAPVIRAMANNNPQRASLFETGRTAMYGGMAGAGMASIVGGVIGSIIPGIGTILGSMAGLAIAGVLGAKAAVDIRNSNNLEKAKQQAMGAAAQTIASASQNLNESVMRAITDIESSVMRAMRDATTRRQEDLQRRRKELQQRQTETVASISEKRAKLASAKRELDAIKVIVGKVR